MVTVLADYFSHEADMTLSLTKDPERWWREDLFFYPQNDLDNRNETRKISNES